MPRSSYVYVLFDIDGKIVGAFTVKHEMQKARDTFRYDTMVWRFRDGVLSEPMEVE